MSQRKDAFPRIDRETGPTGHVLRPLSARFLKVTVPEEKGLVNREMLHDFAGRSRKPQMALAKKLGLTDYPMPAGGCLLTEPNYSYRFKELLEHNTDPSLNEFHLLRIGRHFRLSLGCKAIVGRNEKENEAIESFAEKGDFLMTVEGFGSPTVLLSGDRSESSVLLAASICARYSDAKYLPLVEVSVNKNGVYSKVGVTPATNATINYYRIQKAVSDKKPDRKHYAEQAI
jgi:hypothetical protein